MSEAARIVVDYSSALEASSLANVDVIAPDAGKQRFGDPAPRATYTAALREALRQGPEPVLCLVGPYGYSPAFTAAAGGRNDLAREEIDPDRVHVLNVGRSFLGLGALTASLSQGELGPDDAMAWLDDAGVATGMWVVAESERLETAPAEAFIEAPDGIPEEPYALLRVRLASRVMGGFESIEEAADGALASVSAAGGVGLVVNAPEGLDAWKRATPAPVEWRPCELPTFLATHFGEALTFAIAPKASA